MNIDIEKYRDFIFDIIPVESIVHLWTPRNTKEYTKDHNDYNQANKYHATRIVIEKEKNPTIKSVIDLKIYVPRLSEYTTDLHIINYRFHLSRRASPDKLIHQILIPNINYAINKYLIANELFDIMADSHIMDYSKLNTLKNKR